eukprot:141912-Chlamydomonas_euryale.AAC.1
MAVSADGRQVGEEATSPCSGMCGRSHCPKWTLPLPQMDALTAPNGRSHCPKCPNPLMQPRL